MNVFKSVLAFVLFGAVTMSPASADTLILKTGDRVVGNFEGGTAHVVKFRTSSGAVMEYDVLSVQQIQFSNEQKTSSDGSHTFPTGTKITIRMIDSIGSENQTAGSLFLASLETPMMSGSVEVIPKGADVWGRVTDSAKPRLELTQIFANGIHYSVATAEYSAGLDIPSETKLEFTLKEPLVIASREKL